MPEARDSTGHLIRELHGVTLAQIVEYLVARIGWQALHDRVPLKCFQTNPSIRSSLTLLRRTPWARQRIAAVYIEERTEEVLAEDTPHT